MRRPGTHIPLAGVKRNAEGMTETGQPFGNTTVVTVPGKNHQGVLISTDRITMRSGVFTCSPHRITCAVEKTGRHPSPSNPA